jgi:hypothetical protein
MNMILYERCDKLAANQDLTHFFTEPGTLLLRNQCFNAESVTRTGIDNFDNHPLDRIPIVGVDGASHTVYFRTRQVGAKVTLDAFEINDGKPSGYHIQLIGEPGEDRYVQLGRMVQKIRRALDNKNLEEGEHGLQFVDMAVKGHIEADMSNQAHLFGERLPILVIDGREISWTEFGQMLMTFEGFQFTLKLADRSDDVEG